MTNKITSGIDLPVLSDQPSLSSAALSTTLEMLNDSFRPEFTHQCLSGETYRGHCPLERVMEEKNHSLYHPEAILHRSHQLHSEATFFLDVKIQLAPSCRRCRIVIDRTPVQTNTSDTTERANKKIKLVEPLSEEEIKNSIVKALPTISNEDCRDDYLDEHLGDVLTEYSCNCRDHKQPQHFMITVAAGRSVVEYHSEVQGLALWFIENADNVNVGDEQSGFWKVLYLFQKHETIVETVNKRYSLVGYMTLFHFNAPFHKPTPGIIVRICQALVLPPFQGQGHGTRMMECVYDMSHGKYNDICYSGDATIVQVNVEDPSPGFTFLRNTVDYKLLTRLDSLQWWPAGTAAKHQFGSTITNGDFLESSDAFIALSENDARQVSSKAKIRPRQIQLVNELVHLRLLLTFLEGEEKEKHSDATKEELEKRFRLMVKKRLNRENREELSSFPTKDEKKAHLARLFDLEVEPYKAWMRKQEQGLQKCKTESTQPVIH